MAAENFFGKTARFLPEENMVRQQTWYNAGTIWVDMVPAGIWYIWDIWAAVI